MEEQFYDSDSKGNSSINEDNLALRILTAPKATFDYILTNCPNKSIHILFILGGIVHSLDRAQAKDIGDRLPLVAIFFTSIIAGALFGWMAYYFYAWLISLTGKWLGVDTDSRTIRTVLAWASIPEIASLILLIPTVIIFGEDSFKSEISNYTPLRMVFGTTQLILHLALSIWTLVLSVIGIALVQGFSYGKAILNIVLAASVIIVPIGLLALLFGAFI